MAPPILADQLQSLPPMLYIHDQKPVSSYSKGSWGLSVPIRVSGIFTAATVSPSPSLRQRPNCYTIRAGRNLPDKEFRYLRHFVNIREDPDGPTMRHFRNISSQASIAITLRIIASGYRIDLSMSPWSSDYIISGCSPKIWAVCYGY